MSYPHGARRFSSLLSLGVLPNSPSTPARCGRNCVPDRNDRCRILQLGGLYLLFRDDHPSDVAKKRPQAAPGVELEVASIRHQSPTLCRSFGSPDAPGARKARHLDVSEVIVFRVISQPKPGRCRLCWSRRNGGMILRFFFLAVQE